MWWNVAFQCLVRQLGDLARQLDAGRAGADDGERQQPLAFDRVAGPFGQLECAEDASAHFERVVDGLHAGRELREMVVAEIGLVGPGRDDQAVVLGRVALPEQLGDDIAPSQVDVHDVAEQHHGVVLVARTVLVAGAMSPSDRMPVATW